MTGRPGFYARTRTKSIMKGFGKKRPLLIAAVTTIAMAGCCRVDTAMLPSVSEGTYKRTECSVAVCNVMCEEIGIKVTPGICHCRVFPPKGCHRDKIRRPALSIAASKGNAGIDNVARLEAECRRIVIMLNASYSGKINYT